MLPAQVELTYLSLTYSAITILLISLPSQDSVHENGEKVEVCATVEILSNTTDHLTISLATSDVTGMCVQWNCCFLFENLVPMQLRMVLTTWEYLRTL